jgi:hypothetical protein
VAAASIVEGGGLDTTRAGDHLTIGLGVRAWSDNDDCPVFTNYVYMYVLEVFKTLTQYCGNNANV